MQAQIVSQDILPAQKKMTGGISITRDYKKFKLIKGNRVIVRRHVDRLARSITANNLLASNPIIVNAKMEVIDGQHRLAAAEQLQVPIFYVISEVANLDDIIRLNSEQKVWSTEEFVRSYAVRGRVHYQRTLDFMAEYELCLQAAMIFLGGSNDGDVYKRIRRGTWSFTDEQLEAAKGKADILTDIVPFMTPSKFISPYLYRAVAKLYDENLGKDFTTKLGLARVRLLKFSNERDYLRYFEEVLNWNRKTELIRLF